MWTNDPVADFLSYDASQQDALEQLPVCDICGEPIQDEYCYEIHGKYICEDCMTEYFRKSVDEIMGW